MANAQQWLDKEYPLEKRKEITKLDVSNKCLEGALSLKGFVNLKKFTTFSPDRESEDKSHIKSSFSFLRIGRFSIHMDPKENRNKISCLDLSGAPNLKELNCRHSFIKKLIIKNNKELVALDCSNNEIEELDLRGLNKLRKICCDENPQLTKLEISELINLEFISCRVCNLVDIDLSQLDPEKLKHFDLLDNNLSSRDLSSFSRFTNLIRLTIGNYYTKIRDNEKAEESNYNHFYGSLEPLKNLNKLNWLDIANTDIDRGLEYLPISIEKFLCDNNKRPEAKCKNIMEQLALFRSSDESYGGSYNFRAWKLLNTIGNLSTLNLVLKEEKEEEVFVKKDDDLETLVDEEEDNLREEEIRIKRNAGDLEDLIKKINEAEEKLEKISSIILPGTVTTRDFSTLKAEVEKLKSESLRCQIKTRKDELKKLIDEAKNKLGEESEFLLDILLEVQTEIVTDPVDNSTKKSLESLQSSLSKKIDEKKVKEICQKQKEIAHLEQANKFLESPLEKEENIPSKLTEFSEQVLENKIEIPPKH